MHRCVRTFSEAAQGIDLSKMPGAHADLDNDTPSEWECSTRGCLFVVDCQPVQRVLVGLAPLRDAVAQPVFEGICANMVSILECRLGSTESIW